MLWKFNSVIFNVINNFFLASNMLITSFYDDMLIFCILLFFLVKSQYSVLCVREYKEGDNLVASL